MKIFVDENIPLITVEELRLKGFDVADIRGSSEQGMPDDQLWLKVQEEKRVLITTDKGFSNYRNEAHHGFLIIRLRQPTRLRIHQKLLPDSGFLNAPYTGLLDFIRKYFFRLQVMKTDIAP